MEQHQAELAILQAKADATNMEVQECGATIATLTSRQVELAAERARTMAPSMRDGRSEDQDGTQYARKCVEDIFAGVLNFSNGRPQVELLLQQLIAAIDTLRAPVPDPQQHS